MRTGLLVELCDASGLPVELWRVFCSGLWRALWRRSIHWTLLGSGSQLWTDFGDRSHIWAPRHPIIFHQYSQRHMFGSHLDEVSCVVVILNEGSGAAAMTE